MLRNLDFTLVTETLGHKENDVERSVITSCPKKAKFITEKQSIQTEK